MTVTITNNRYISNDSNKKEPVPRYVVIATMAIIVAAAIRAFTTIIENNRNNSNDSNNKEQRPSVPSTGGAPR